MSRNRAGAILIEDSKVLLIHRIKGSKEYWVFPGGGIEKDETPQAAIIREMLEETSLVVEIISLAIEIQTNFNNTFATETYFSIKRISGEAKLSIDSPEANRMIQSNNKNFYELVWVPISELDNLIVYPNEIKNYVSSIHFDKTKLLSKLRIMIVTTTNSVDNYKVTKYLGIVCGEVILGGNIFKDFMAGITNVLGGRSNAYESSLIEARESALGEMQKRAQALGANGVVGVALDYQVIDQEGGGNMMMVSCSGTAVYLD